MNKHIKKLAVLTAMVITLSIPMTTASACGRNHRARHHHHFFMKHHAEVQPQTEAETYSYYHDILGMNKAAYLIQIKHLP